MRGHPKKTAEAEETSPSKPLAVAPVTDGATTVPPVSDLNTYPVRPAFLDKLFTTLATLPPGQLEASIQALCAVFVESYEDVAIGVCVATGEGQLVVRSSPRPSQPHVQDPTRLFSEFDHEWVVDIGRGSTLHIATIDPEHLLSTRGASDRLALALRFVIDRTSAFDDVRATKLETEELRLQIIQSEKLASLGQIAAGIAHELNNPLTSILAYSDYLRRDWEKRGMDAADTERIRRIGEAADRILAFTRDLIAYSRPSASVPGPVDIRSVLERALLFCEHTIMTSGVALERDFHEVRLVSGVGGQLTQVFVNLITNACQAMSTGGKLLITTEMSENQEHVIVRVHDEGHGIRAEHMARLFEPYFTTKSDGVGTGLGLPIVQKIVKNHGGAISATNTAAGAVFTVELPASARISLVDL